MIYQRNIKQKMIYILQRKILSNYFIIGDALAMLPLKLRSKFKHRKQYTNTTQQK